MTEKVLYRASPAMFRNRPIWFSILTLCLLGFFIKDASPIGFFALFVFIVWWIRCRGRSLIITDQRSTLRKGILSKATSEVWHENVRNVQMEQSLGQRIFGVGKLGISSAGQSGMEIEISGISNPEKAKKIIDQHRKS